MTARGARRAALVLAGLALLSPTAPLVAQEVPTVAQEEPVDSARLRVLERLRLLARPPGSDSVLFAQDSASLAAAAAGNRPTGQAPDDIARELLRIPGYTLTQYEAESADFAADRRVLVLQAPEEGRARVSREGIVIEADSSISFDEASGRMRTRGMATFTPPDGDPTDAANMIYDLNENRGSAVDARTAFNQGGAEWRVTGQMPYASQDSTFMSHAQFTSCDNEEPHYHFTTNEIKIVGGNVLVARGVRLYFADVPVAWLPFVAQSLARGRASGLLTPRFSVNDIVRTSGGYRRRVSNVGFYWAMSDYTDALMALDWFSDTFTSLTGSFRYRVNRQFLTGDLSARRYWRADGSNELAIDTRHDWEVDERTRLDVSGRYVTSSDFVSENSFNPLEVTQSIDSNAGLSRRFDWGNLSAAANRKQYLSDDRTEWTMPQLNLSLSPITLFSAPPSEAHVWNNVTWSGSGSYRRNTVDYAAMSSDTFDIGLVDTENTTSGANSSIRFGGLTLSQSANLRSSSRLGVPEAYLLLPDSARGTPVVVGPGEPLLDVAESTLSLRGSVSYQQQLIGSTTLTPNFSVSRELFRSDTDSLARNFVGAPYRMAVGAQLKTDLYGFFPGFGAFDAIRHKVSPSFDYQWSPETKPTPLQQSVFGSRALQPRNTVSLTLAQTFEARRASSEEQLAEARDSIDAAQTERPRDEPRRVARPQIVTLLALRTSVVRYDFVQADSVGQFLAGFETTQLSNQISSDYLRGLSISLNHDLFDDEFDDEGDLVGRSFSPHLSQMNLGFSLGSSSSIFRWLGFGGGGDDEPEEPDADDDLGLVGPTEESMVIPGLDREDEQPQPTRRSGSAGGWTANLTYSLRRPRDPDQLTAQMLTATVRLEPTQNWSASWRTSYDLEEARFNDHSIRLTRDLHRWQANFDFLQTATGNWTFRFEVTLIDNQDLKFDYSQRNLDLGLPSGRR